MIKLEFEHLIERPISDEEFRKIQLVYMNTEAIETPLQMSYIYLVWGEKGIDILYSLVMERGRLIEEVGEFLYINIITHYKVFVNKKADINTL